MKKEYLNCENKIVQLFGASNAELARMVTVRDHRITVLERALRNTVESWCIMDNPNNPDDIYNRAIDQAEKELEGEE